MRWITRFFAVIGFIVVAVAAFGGYTFYRHMNEHPTVPEQSVLTVTIDGDFAEEERNNPILSLGDSDVLLRDVVRGLKRAARDDKVKGVVLDILDAPALAQVQEIEPLLLDLRKRGKFVYAFSPTFGEGGNGNASYVLASAAEKIVLQPGGLVSLQALAVEMPFARALLDEYGVTPQITARKSYKTAFASFTDKEMSPANKEMLQSLLSSITDQITGRIAANRGISREVARDWLNTGPYTAPEALTRRLVDELGYLDQIDAEAKKKAGDHADTIALDNYLSITDHEGTKGKQDDTTQVALIYATGLVQQSAGDGLSRETTATTEQQTKAFDAAIEDKDIKVIVLRVDSEGGSPIAAESIRRQVLRAKEAGKKVVASFARVAGSGGYWLAVDADRIFADPATLTGSIGVVGGKVATEALLDRFHINWQQVTTGPNGGMWSPVTPFTPDQQRRFDQQIDQTYADFIERVANGRKLTPARVEELAQGRVWTGAEAKERGLVDELGGLEEAFAWVRSELKMDADTPLAVRILPQPPSPLEAVVNMLRQGRMGLSAQARALSTLAPLLTTLDDLAPGEAARMQHFYMR